MADITIGLQGNVTVAATTTVIAVAEPTRVVGGFQNQGDCIVWVGLDIPAVVGAGFEVKPGDVFDFAAAVGSGRGNGTDFFVGAVNGIAEAVPERGSTPAATTSIVRVGSGLIP